MAKMTLREACQAMSWHPDFWNPTKLLNMKDKNGLTPGIFAAISNRGGGKTFTITDFFEHWHFMGDAQIGLLCKTQTSLGSIANGVFGASLRDHYPDWKLVEKVSKTKYFSDMYLIRKTKGPDGKEHVEKRKLGMVLAINAGEKLKDYSSAFVDLDVLFLDEFQSSTYQPKEIEKLVFILGSVCRGGDKGVREVPLIMCSNSISITNPYFVAWGCVQAIRPDTKFYRGDGVVIQRFTNELISERQKELGYIRAFGSCDVVHSVTDNSWLNDDYSCISKPEKDWGRSVYIATLQDASGSYGVRRYDNGFFYLNRSTDETCPTVYALTVDGLDNAPLFRTGAIFMTLRDKFARGCVRFSDISVKNLIYRFFV